jgi:hypothetical protein
VSSPEQPALLSAPEREPRLTVLSYGGGQDSCAILARLLHDPEYRKTYAPNDLLVLMSDTGDEHPETIEHVRFAARACAAAGIPFRFIRPHMGCHSEAWSSLFGQYHRNATIGSKLYSRTCTANLKLAPIYRYIEAWIGRKYGFPTGAGKIATKKFVDYHGAIRVLIGIAADEGRRIANAAQLEGWMAASLERRYPLHETGWDRAACQAYIRTVGWEVPVPSNCLRCHFSTPQDLLLLHRRHPEKWAEWVAAERAKLKKFAHKGDRNLGVYGTTLLPEALERAEAEHGHRSTEDLLAERMTRGHCVTNAY